MGGMKNINPGVPPPFFQNPSGDVKIPVQSEVLKKFGKLLFDKQLQKYPRFYDPSK